MATLPARAPDTLLQLARDLDVENNFAFLPHRRLVFPAQPGFTNVEIGGQVFSATGQLTLCNMYASAFMAGLGLKLPLIKANEQLSWLDSADGRSEGWFKINRLLAIDRAGFGYPTLAVAYDVPHGHVAAVMPSASGDPATVYVSAAGGRNIRYGRMGMSFGALEGKALFYTHN